VPKKGETIVVSGAASAVGGIVGQVGKILGCRVVGIASTEEKVAMLKSKFGFDDGINYNTTKDIKKSIAATCPNGVDIYFDNVGVLFQIVYMPTLIRLVGLSFVEPFRSTMKPLFQQGRG
jgi:NADPH-dependent curcumin reductase CurA